MLDHFFMGPNLVRGFAHAGIGPTDANSSTQDALGGTLYWGATLELQYPLFFAPRDFGMKVALFADAGSLWDYRGLQSFGGRKYIPDHCPRDDMIIRSSVGVGLIWDSPFGPIAVRLCGCDHQGYDHGSYQRRITSIARPHPGSSGSAAGRNSDLFARVLALSAQVA